MEWISVEERLPETGEEVIVFIAGFEEDGSLASYSVREGVLFGTHPNGWWQGLFLITEFLVTHWMPLPGPPEEYNG